ncbi:MAG: sigma-70 family RNA polymerase sigma factor [Acidobacteriaceae bacterium]|nr:sigma-70 family RNA polymerase sigma factor [Acidobacteriaceae bacterium]
MAVPWMGPFMLEQTRIREWIIEAKTGDGAAFERIVILHERMVLRTAQRLLMNDEDAKDAAQEAFLRLHRNLHQFHESKELLPWLYRITVNICLDAKRRQRPSPGLDEIPEAMDLSASPEEVVSTKQQRAIVSAALGELSRRERAAIVLRDFEGCTTAEVAKILGSTEGTVRSQISSGRTRMKKFVMARLRRRT